MSALRIVVVTVVGSFGCGLEPPARMDDDEPGTAGSGGGGKTDIWEEESRRELYEFPSNSLERTAAKSVAIMVESSHRWTPQWLADQD